MRLKPVDPKTYGFTADEYATLRQKILHIRGAKGKAVISPNRVGHDLKRKTKAFKARLG